RGEVAQRAYGATTAAGPVTVVDIENRTAGPLTVAMVLRVGRVRVDVERTAVRVDGGGAPALSAGAPPVGGGARGGRRWRGGGGGWEGPVESFAGPGELALLFPVTHRTSVRAAAGACAGAVDVRELPTPDAVARGWRVQLERGMQAELAPPVGDVVDAARAD